MKKVIFYTQIFYLDAALEYINIAKNHFELHVFIELAPESRKANIFSIESSLDGFPLLVSFSDVAQDWNLGSLANFFEGCKNVYFVTHPHKRSLSFSSISRAFQLVNIFSKINADFLHFDDLSLRMIGLLPFVLRHRNQTILNVHDPKPHSGEINKKKEILKSIYFRIIQRYVCFSSFSSDLLSTMLGPDKKVATHKLLPYTYYEQVEVSKASSDTDEFVTFIGRISRYKGIELFLEAIDRISSVYPNQKFMIAGKVIRGYNPFTRISPNTSVITEHLSNEKLVEIISKSSLVVCPYLDATQSGVIMTCYALGKPVLVTPVGGLPEYVQGVTDLVVDSMSSTSLADSILKFISSSIKGRSCLTFDFDIWREAYRNDLIKLYNDNTAL